MTIIIKGRHLKSNEKILVTDLAQWCAVKLLGPRISKNVQISIHTAKSDIYTENQLYGTTEVDEDDERSKPRIFKIVLTGRFEILRTLMIVAHEMVHVKQYAIGELGYCSRSGQSKWQGSRICEDQTEYWDLPWEIEAHGREKGLVYMWAQERGHLNQPWYKELF